MGLGNIDIEGNVNALIGAWLKKSKKELTDDETVLVRAAADLVINLLQNINDIAWRSRQ
jgi:hypothetical protein